MTCGRRAMVLGAFVLASLSVFVGTALPAKTYPDATRDVPARALPDRDHWLDADVLDPALAPRRRPLVHLHRRRCA